MESSSAAALVTGQGLVTPLGNTLAEFDSALMQGRSAIRAEQVDLPGLDTALLAAARCRDFDAAKIMSASRLPMDRGTAMALASARDAMAASGLAQGAYNPERLGIYWGSGMGGAGTFDDAAKALYANQRRMRPTTVLTVMPNAAVAELALEFGAQGAALAYACACASSTIAIGEAMRALRGGWIDVAIVGGHEAMLTPAVMACWHAMRVLAAPPAAAPEAACRPFSADRSGFALGEGAAAFVLETSQHAQSRGAKARAALSGYATNCDGSHMTKPDPAGQARVMRAALRDAGLSATDIGAINAHGTATTAGDTAEAASIGEVFGSATPVSATKAIHGHVLGGGGAIELMASLRALELQTLPPIAHLQIPDEAFAAIDLVRGGARTVQGLRHVLSNSFAFGGTNAVLIASRLDA
jgi:3-oxoacyl-[acyl-carrier-protein] synthase II